MKFAPVHLEIVQSLLQFIGEDASRQGLKETPERFLKALKEWTSGYDVEPASVLKHFEDGAADVNELVIVRDIPVYSMCEHHMAPFFGTAAIGYIPNGRIIGLSKMSRLVDIYARRLQVQERLTNQIADALFEGLKPHGVAVVLSARHMCMESRGIRTPGQKTLTSARRGLMQEDDRYRHEFLPQLKD